MRAFLKGVDKRDEKFIIQALKGTEVEAGDRVIKRGTWDRCVLVVADGELIAFREDGENDVYSEGAILGIEQFLFNKQWNVDIICGKTAIITKLKWETLMDLVPTQALTAARLYKRVMRHYCYMQLYDTGKKTQNQHLFNFKNITDEDLMIDFKLSLKDTKDKQLFNMLSQARKPAEIGHREKKGEEIDTMPYFLTDKYAAILSEQERCEQINKESTGNQQQQSSGAYKSRFLKDKISQQNESRKGQKKGTKPQANNQPGEKQSGKPTRQKGENEEQLLEVIEDLRNDLKVRDLEYEQVRNRLEKLEAQNTFLAEKLLAEKRNK